jgi:hypothetical protein
LADSRDETGKINICLDSPAFLEIFWRTILFELLQFIGQKHSINIMDCRDERINLGYGQLIAAHKKDVTKVIHKLLTTNFHQKKNRRWVQKITTTAINHLISCSNHAASDKFVQACMKPFIHRNFCTMTAPGEEKASDGDIPVPTMYSLLYTFLQGSKRRQALNFHIGSEVTRKIFDHLNIQTPDGIKWSSFSSKALNSAESS